MIERTCVNEITEEEKVTMDNFETNLKVDLKWSSNEKNMEKDVVDTQMRLMDVSFHKGGVQFLNRKRNWDNFFLLDPQTKLC